MNQEDVVFKSHFFLENVSLIDKGFTCNITHDSNNEVTSIVRIILSISVTIYP